MSGHETGLKQRGYRVIDLRHDEDLHKQRKRNIQIDLAGLR